MDGEKKGFVSREGAKGAKINKIKENEVSCFSKKTSFPLRALRLERSGREKESKS
jgi:hypothetical protein